MSKLRAVLVAIERRLGVTHRHVYRVPAASSESSLPPDPRIRAVAQAELLALTADERLDLTQRWVGEARARGDRCLGAFLDGRFAGFVWLARRRAPHVDGIEVLVPENAQYRYKTFVLPEFRGRGIATALYLAADRLMAAEGACQAVLCIAPANEPSVRSAVASGAVRVGTILFWHTPRRFVSFHSPGARRAGVRFARLTPPREPQT